MPSHSHDVRFSNRPSGVKHFQTVHHCNVDITHGLALLSGIGTRALPSWDPRTRRNNLWVGLAVRRRQVQADMRTHLILPPIGSDPVRVSCSCCGLLSGPAELSSVNPDAVHDHATTEAAIGACDDVLAADYVGEPHDSVRHQLRMLQHVSSVADHARDDDLTIWQRCLLPHLPLVFVSRVASLDGIALRLYLKQQIDHVLELDV